MQDGPDPAMNCAILPVHNATLESLEAVQMDAVLTFSDYEVPVQPGGKILPGKRLHQLFLPEGEKRFPIEISEAGAYALFTEHHPKEFQANVFGSKLLHPLIAKQYKPDHEHDERVSSVGITAPGDLDEKKLNGWLRDVLMNQGPDIFRMKGILSIKDDARRFVFQGVHMLLDGRPDREWGSEQRHNSLIFIGRNFLTTEASPAGTARLFGQDWARSDFEPALANPCALSLSPHPQSFCATNRRLAAQRCPVSWSHF
jgi:hypothetical protein